MNPFTEKIASRGRASKLVEKTRQRVEKNMKESDNETRRNEQEAQRAADDQQKQMLDSQKQEEQQRRTTSQNVSVAARTPNFQPYSIRKSAGLFGSLARSFRGGRVPWEYGAAPANSVVWDQLLYDENTDPMKRFGMGALNTAIGIPAFRATRTGSFMGKPLSPDKRSLSFATGAFAEPLGARGSMEGLAWLGKQNEIADKKRKLLDRELENPPGNNDESKDDKLLSNGQIAALSALAAVPVGVYAWDKIFNKPDEDEKEKSKRPDPDRVALEIPSYKISDSLYNNIGREILFEDKKEKERQLAEDKSKKAANENERVAKTEKMRENMSPGAFGKWFRDQNKPKGFWSAIERKLPLISPLVGGPQLNSFRSRLSQHMQPIDPGKADPFVSGKWSETMKQYQYGGTGQKWTGGGNILL